MSQATPTPEAKPKSKRLIIIMFLVIVAVVLVFAKTNVYQQGYQWFLTVSGAKPQSNKMVTYYQWTDHKGELQVSRELPSNSVNYISFQASEDLQQTTNKVDSSVIERGERYRQQVLASDGETRETSGSIPTGGAEMRGPAGIINCVRINTRIATLKSNIRAQTTASDKRKYQTELAELERKGC